MQRYILRRLIYAVPTLLILSIIIFIAMRIIPGDPVIAMLGGDSMEGVVHISAADRAAIEEQLGLADPLAVQYLNWMRDIATLKLGESFFTGDKVMDKILRRGPISAEIGLLSIALSWLIGLPAGVLSALRPNSGLDVVLRGITVLFLAIPGFWLGMLIVLMLLNLYKWAPPFEIVQLWEGPIANLTMVALPALVLGLGTSAGMVRIVRSSMLEAVRQDYVRTARAKGLMERLVLMRHTLPNALLPVVTLSGLSLGFVLGGTVAIEVAFGVRGLGMDLVEAIKIRDWNVIQNLVLVYGIVFVFINLVVDVSYGIIDPRIRYE